MQRENSTRSGSRQQGIQLRERDKAGLDVVNAAVW